MWWVRVKLASTNFIGNNVFLGTPHIQLPVFSAIIFPTFIQLTCGQDVTFDSLQNITIISFSCTVFNGSEPWTLSIYKDGKLTNYTVPFTISNPTDETYGTFTFVVSTQHCGSASMVSRLLQRGQFLWMDLISRGGVKYCSVE